MTTEQRSPTESRLNIDRLIKTKIVCTLGPASSSEQVLEQMIKAGMDCARLNFSHGSPEEMRQLFGLVRKLSAKYDHQVAIICDIQGPKIRTGRFKEPIVLIPGDRVKVTNDEILGTKEQFQIKYPTLIQDLNQGDLIFINDGIIKIKVENKSDKFLECVVEAGGNVSDHKGCNIPSGNLSVEILTNKDKKDLVLIAELDPEYVASSFIGSAEDVLKIKRELKNNGNPKIKVISKIERPVACANISSIIEVTDAIMVARGDLGVEIPTWQVPIEQKKMCKLANAAGKPVIVATQMLESMTTSSRPTRAEASDVFNAVLDGADAVMLSGETSVGKHPVTTVKVMDDIIAAAEQYLANRNPDEFDSQHQGITETLSHGCFTMVQQFHKLGFNQKIIVMTEPPSGYTARMVSKYRPNTDIIALTSDMRTCRELDLVWGVRSVFFDGKTLSSGEEGSLQAIKKMLAMDLLKKKDKVIVVSRSSFGKHVGTFCGIYDVEKLLEAIHTID